MAPPRLDPPALVQCSWRRCWPCTRLSRPQREPGPRTSARGQQRSQKNGTPAPAGASFRTGLDDAMGCGEAMGCGDLDATSAGNFLGCATTPWALANRSAAALRRSRGLRRRRKLRRSRWKRRTHGLWSPPPCKAHKLCLTCTPQSTNKWPKARRAWRGWRTCRSCAAGGCLSPLPGRRTLAPAAGPPNNADVPRQQHEQVHHKSRCVGELSCWKRARAKSRGTQADFGQDRIKLGRVRLQT